MRAAAAARLRRAACCAAPATAAGALRLEYTALEGNSFRFMLPSGVTVLVDPWLVGALTFGPPPLDALYSGRKPSGELGIGAAAGSDVILLSQGLPDHAHEETLRQLDKRLPVVASPTGAAVARACGFTDVRSLAHGESCLVRGVRFTATPGALVGPPWSTRENGFLVEDGTEGLLLYYEPHCDHARDALAATLGGRRVDVAVLPVAAISLAGYPLVLGSPERVLDLLRLLMPAVLVPLRNDLIREQGVIAPLVWTEPGAVVAVRAALQADAQLMQRVRIVEPAAAGVSLRVDV